MTAQTRLTGAFSYTSNYPDPASLMASDRATSSQVYFSGASSGGYVDGGRCAGTACPPGPANGYPAVSHGTAEFDIQASNGVVFVVYGYTKDGSGNEVLQGSELFALSAPVHGSVGSYTSALQSANGLAWKDVDLLVLPPDICYEPTGAV